MLPPWSLAGTPPEKRAIFLAHALRQLHRTTSNPPARPAASRLRYCHQCRYPCSQAAFSSACRRPLDRSLNSSRKKHHRRVQTEPDAGWQTAPAGYRKHRAVVLRRSPARDGFLPYPPTIAGKPPHRRLRKSREVWRQGVGISSPMSANRVQLLPCKKQISANRERLACQTVHCPCWQESVPHADYPRHTASDCPPCG